MNGAGKFIKAIRLNNFLSYGNNDEWLELESLNVMIGPNSSGKSNLIEALGLLNAAPKDLAAPIRKGGGVSEWLYKGAESSSIAEIDVTIGRDDETTPLRYRLSFTETGRRFELVDEAVECERKKKPDDADVDFYYRYQRGNPVLTIRSVAAGSEQTESLPMRRPLERTDLEAGQSILSQIKDPIQYPELTSLGSDFLKMKFFREWNPGPYAPPRQAQKVDLPEDFLLEDASNLGLVLNDLQNQPVTKRIILEKLRAFNESIDDVTTNVYGGTIQLFLHQSGLNQPVPATRLSDGTLRFICLLAILCHPNPPEIVCIEEPELGLHPDVLPLIADLLMDASSRTQLFVTTHSDVLVSALSEVPECVIVCEQDDLGTRLLRLEKEKLTEWLKKYSLGELWRMGEIGGV